MYSADNSGSPSLQQSPESILSSVAPGTRSITNSDLQIMSYQDSDVPYALSGVAATVQLCNAVGTIQNSATTGEHHSAKDGNLSASMFKELSSQEQNQLSISGKRRGYFPAANNVIPAALSHAAGVSLQGQNANSLSPYESSSEISTLTYGTSQLNQNFESVSPAALSASASVISAVEAARVRAQRQAEWYAFTRKDHLLTKQTSKQGKPPIRNENLNDADHPSVKKAPPNIVSKERQTSENSVSRPRCESGRVISFSIGMGNLQAEYPLKKEANAKYDDGQNSQSLLQTNRSVDKQLLNVSKKSRAVQDDENIKEPRHGTRSSIKYGDGDDTGTEEEDRISKYKRRLAMNRESAAVSRVRRRAYIKELEERLATVEAEKFQLIGKLEAVMQQNTSMASQLDNLFLLVATGQHPGIRSNHGAQE